MTAMTWTIIPYKAPPSGDVIDKLRQERTIIDWCHEHFPDSEWLIYPKVAEFEREEDAMLFALRWS